LGVYETRDVLHFCVRLSGFSVRANSQLAAWHDHTYAHDRVPGSEQLIPLAEVTRFRLQKNEMLIRIDDAAKMSHFHIKAMVLRPEWDRNQMLEEAEANAMITRHLDPATLREQ
jgi:hypothetical protein